MDALRILLVEDDISAALDVEMLLADMGYTLMATIKEGNKALATILEEQPDLIIMDIELKGKLSGMDIAKEIKHLEIPIIFTTSYTDKQMFNEAKETYSFGYIVKPFDKLTLQSTIEQAVKTLYSGETLDHDTSNWKDGLVKDSLLVKHNNILYKVRFEEILFIQGEGNYCTLNTASKKYVVKMSLKKVLEELPGEFFLPIHKSHIANLAAIESIDPGSNKVLIGKLELPIGRNFKNLLLERFKLLK
jgi:DNA-binding LytR/AlgR family response regulator